MKKIFSLIIMIVLLFSSCSKDENLVKKLGGEWQIDKALQFSSCSSYDDISSTIVLKELILFEDNTARVILTTDSIVEGDWEYFQTSSQITIEDIDGEPLILTTFFDNIQFNWDSPVEYFTTSIIDEANNNQLVLKNPHKGGELKLHFKKNN